MPAHLARSVTSRLAPLARPPAALLAVLAGALLALAAGGRPATSKLAIELTDAETGAVLPGLVRARDASGKPLRLEPLLCRGKGLDAAAAISQWWVVPGRSTVEVPAGKVTVEAIAGLERELARLELDLTGREAAEARLALVRFRDPAAKGLRSANTHLHLSSLSREEAWRYLREIPKADGLDIVFLSYLERAGDDVGYVSNGFSAADLAELSKSGVLFGNGEEHRHNFGPQGEGYGHVMLLDILKLVQPVSIGPGIAKRGTDAPPLQKGIDEARRDGATTLWCHNDWGFEDVPNWLSGRLDAQNIFDGGEHGSYRESFYRLLDVGLRVPFSTGTDWFQYDFSRVYAPVAGPLTTKAWLRSLAAGRSFITNGPLLELEVGGRGVGSTVRLERPGKIHVVARAAGRTDFERIELVRSGKVVETAASRRAGGHFEAELRVDLEAREPCWLALRTPPPPVPGDPELQAAVPANELGKPLFAHTSPVYVEVAGKGVFDRAVAESLLQEMESNVKLIEEKAVFAGDHEREHVLAVHRTAMEVLRRRLREE
ncbi:MAG: CehA/McbA family metallohydrolase [Planctomycetes bacterium]|nr:CehA/McbA family metallohydrolase [Planctomycetota bacterium]